MRKAIKGEYTGFVAGENIEEARDYFRDWYGEVPLEWLEQFRFKSNDELELLTTVDFAVKELEADNRDITVENVKEIIKSDPEWKPKLRRKIYSDEHIDSAIRESCRLFQ